MKRQFVFCCSVLVLCQAGAWANPAWYFYDLYGTDDPGLTAIAAGPSINNAGQVAFIGTLDNTRHCLRGSGGPLTRMDDATHPASTSIFCPTINGSGAVAYLGTVLGATRVCRSDGTTVTALFPSPLDSPIGMAINNSGTVATGAEDLAAGKFGTFTTDGTTVTTVAKQGMTAPQSGGGTFADVWDGPDINDSGTVVFLGSTGTVRGIYASSGGVLSRVIDSSTGITPTFTRPRINDSGVVAFDGKDTMGWDAVYISSGGNTCQKVADVTGAGLYWVHEDSLALNNNGLLAYAGFDTPISGKDGIYTAGAAGGTVAVEGGTINGRTVSWLWFGADGLNDYGQLAFCVGFAGDSNAYIYVASPFPCAAPMGLARGTGTVTYEPDGFTSGGFTTAGLGGATPLPATVEIDCLTLDGGMATVIGAYDPTEVAALGLDEATLRLYWDNAGTWVLAGRQSNINQMIGEFVAGAPTPQLGDWGIDIGGNYVWANVDHASTFAMAGVPVPEPGTIALLSVGILGLIRRRR